MLLTGIASFYIGLREVALIQNHFERTLKRLVERNVILLPNSSTVESFAESLEEKAQLWIKATGLLAAVAMMIAFIHASSDGYTIQRVLLAIAESIGAYIGGNYLGRMVWYGQLGRWLIKDNADINIDPSHLDGLCGLKPVGEYYFYQAMIVSIPAIFLAVWWLLIPVWPKDYRHWLDPYFGLLIIAIIVQFCAFVIPLLSFHKMMVAKKQSLISEADQLSADITKIRTKISKSHDSEETKGLKEVLEEANKRYWSIENMKTWPVDIKTRKRFGLNNFLLVTPLVINVYQQNFKWEELLKTLLKINQN